MEFKLYEYSMGGVYKTLIIMKKCNIFSVSKSRNNRKGKLKYR